MADWIIPCNPDYYDVFAAFNKLSSIDWRQSAKNIMPGDTVYIYVGSPVQAVAFRCVATKVMIPRAQADFSDAEFEKGESLEPGQWYMRLNLVRKIPPDLITFDRMRRAGLKGYIQGPRLLPKELKELFATAQQPGGKMNAAVSDSASKRIVKDMEKRQKIPAEQYDTEKIMQDLKAMQEIDPDSHDGSYRMMRETVKAYSHLRDYSALDYHDLNLIYLTSVGTWKHGIEVKKKTVDESHLIPLDKYYLKNLWDETWRKAGKGEYTNYYQTGNSRQSIGMFGTGFYTFQNKTTANDVRAFVDMCVKILPMEDEDRMFARAERVFAASLNGLQAASASMILHCLKPFAFPILNTNMGYRNIFELLGVHLSKTYYLEAYIDNCRKIRAFRDQNFSFRNYRIFDMAVWDVKKYMLHPASGHTEPQNNAEELREPEEKISVETQVNVRVREEFMRQIREKKAVLKDLDMKRENILKEIRLLEDMLSKL